MMLMIMIWIIQSVSSVSNNFKDQWQSINRLDSFEATLNEFPYLRKTVDARIITNLLQKGGCRYGKFQTTRFLILNNTLYTYGQQNTSDPGNVTRKYFIELLKRHQIPDMYFIIHFYDEISHQKFDRVCRQLPMFMFNKKINNWLERTKFLLPDYYLMNENWGKQIEEVRNASKDLPWEKKQNKLFFRGMPSGPHFWDVEINQKADLKKYFHRGQFVFLSVHHPELIDAKFTSSQTIWSNQIQRRVGQNITIFAQRSSTLAEHVRFKYLLSADGFAAAWKRIPFILFSNSLLFKTYSQNTQWFYDALIPGQNFVSIKEDLSDLFQQVDFLNQNPQKCKDISQKANTLAEKYLTPKAIEQHILETFYKYADLQKMKLSLEQAQLIVDGVDIHTILMNKIEVEWWQKYIILSFLILSAVVFWLVTNLKLINYSKSVTQTIGF